MFEPDKFRKLLMEANVKKDARQAVSAEKKNRNIAEQNDKYKPTFLRPNDVSGEYDFKRALKTTLGGLELRDITLADLEAFGRNIETIGTLYKGGITIPQIISFSRGEDIDRANREIHTVMPASRRAGDVMFITNSGPKSDKPNHVVSVEFLAFDSIVLNPKREKASTIKNRLGDGKVKIECDCGRFTYWYRYIATLGNFVHGRKEAGFPKERNPDLTGIACKHILSTVNFIRSPLGQQYLKRAIEKDRTKQHGRRYSETAQSMAKMLDQQVAQRASGRYTIKPAVNTEVKKLVKRIESQAKQLQQNQSKLDEKGRRIARLKANYAAGLIDKQDYDFYMSVENARKY